MRSIATCDVSRIADFLIAVGFFQRRSYPAIVLGNCDELSWTLNMNSERSETIGEQTFVFILRIDQEERIRSLSFAEFVEEEMCGSFSAGPEISAGNFAARGDDRVCETDLLVELECASCECNRARSRSRSIDFVDDSNRDAEFGEPQSEHEPSGARADDQNRNFTRIGHFLRVCNVKVGAEARGN